MQWTLLLQQTTSTLAMQFQNNSLTRINTYQSTVWCIPSTSLPFCWRSWLWLSHGLRQFLTSNCSQDFIFKYCIFVVSLEVNFFFRNSTLVNFEVLSSLMVILLYFYWMWLTKLDARCKNKCYEMLYLGDVCWLIMFPVVWSSKNSSRFDTFQKKCLFEKYKNTRKGGKY